MSTPSNPQQMPAPWPLPPPALSAVRRDGVAPHEGRAGLPKPGVGRAMTPGPAAQAMPAQSLPASSARSESPPDAGYSSDEFESEDGSQSPGSPGGTVHCIGEPGSRTAPRQPHTLWSTCSASSSASRGRSERSERGAPPTQSPVRSTRLGYMAATAAVEAKRSAAAGPGKPGSRPCSASPQRKAAARQAGCASPMIQASRAASPGPAPDEDLDARVAQQIGRDPASWSVREVCDWLEVIGLGQYRRKFVHNAVCGVLLLRLTSEELKSDIGMGPLGHREGLLTAVRNLQQHWTQAGAQAARQEAAGHAARPVSAGPPRLDISLQGAYAQRTRLLRELEKAEGREAQRRVAAEQALRVVGQASTEVRKLQASLCELDREIGWEGAAGSHHPLDARGALPWQPAGRQRAPPRPGSPGSPVLRPGGLGAGHGCGRPGSPAPRGNTVGKEGCGPGASFLDRLAEDLASRQAKREAARRQAGRPMGGADERLAERKQAQRHLRLVRAFVLPRDEQLAKELASGDGARMAAACDAAAQRFQADCGLDDDALHSLQRASSPEKKLSKLACALHSNEFMQRLERDLATRDSRLKELQAKVLTQDRGSTPAQQEKADLAAAQQHFSRLGWPLADLQPGPSDLTAATDKPLGALLRRAAALQDARQAGTAVDWQEAQWQEDGLDALQAARNAQLRAAIEEQQAARDAAAATRRGLRKGVGRQQELAQPDDHVAKTAELLAACPPGEVALLQGLGGYRKLVMTWRAIRAQQFVAFTRLDLQQRRAKAAALERQMYPDRTRVLSKEQYDAFFDRLMEDTARRAQHREELEAEAREEALAKLKKVGPPAPAHKRPQARSSPTPGGS